MHTSPARGQQLSCGQRVVIIGTSGTGKSTLARALAARLGVEAVELDALFWGPKWTETPLDEFRARVAAALAGEGWVVDGNYSKARDLIWPRTQTLLWLDYRFSVVLWRLTRRTLLRVVLREPLWEGNRESLRTLFSRNSIVVWMLRTYAKYRRTFPGELADPRYAHMTVVRLRSPRATRRWLAALPTSSADRTPLPASRAEDHTT